MVLTSHTLVGLHWCLNPAAFVDPWSDPPSPMPKKLIRQRS